MIIKPLDILVYKGNWYNPITWIIYTRTSTTYTHCAIAVGRGRMIEAVAKGVIEVPLDAHGTRPYLLLRYKHEIHQEHVQAATDWLYNQVECAVGYDFLALIGFLTGYKGFEEEDKFFCSELAVYAFQAAKVDLYSEIPTYIYPSDFISHLDFEAVKDGAN